MSYRGVGNPAIIYEGKRVDLPSPKKGGRKESYEPAWKTYENIDGEILTGTNHKWRFVGEYEFGKVDQNVLDTLIEIYNKSLVVKLIPHSDVVVVAYRVIVEEINPEALDGRIGIDTVKIKVKSRELVSKIPTLDNMIKGYMFTRICRYNK
ncbi:MAG: hypothetical protein PHC43_06830 [Candidatus Marinimicrobia bacterium]|jgi:hypothetical protein|nr:hypothetical protein [Candidatus Neomarinimicrobiota bacterium]